MYTKKNGRNSIMIATGNGCTSFYFQEFLQWKWKLSPQTHWLYYRIQSSNISFSSLFSLTPALDNFTWVHFLNSHDRVFNQFRANHYINSNQLNDSIYPLQFIDVIKSISLRFMPVEQSNSRKNATVPFA